MRFAIHRLPFTMSQPSSAFDLSNLDHARACMHDAFLQAQPPLTDALRLFVQLAFRPLSPRSPADEVRDRLEGKMRAHFVEASQTVFAATVLARSWRL